MRGTARGKNRRGEGNLYPRRGGRCAAIGGRPLAIDDATAPADTFPKLLVRNARVHRDRPALPHDDLGIWQTWTLGAGARRGALMSIGLHRLGSRSAARPSPSSAPTGRRLYWTVMAAADARRDLRCPVYADAVADETGLRAGARRGELRGGARTRSRSTRSSPVLRAACRSSSMMVYDEPQRPARLRPQPACMPSTSPSPRTAAPRSQDASWRLRLDAEIARGKGTDISHHPLHLRHDRPLEGRDAVGGCGRSRRARHRLRFDKLDRDATRCMAYLPLAWVGDHYLNYAQGYRRRASAWPVRKAPTPSMAGPARDRADLLSSRRRASSRHADAADDPHGGCRRV